VLDVGAVGSLEEEIVSNEGEGSSRRRTRKSRVRIVAGTDGEGSIMITVVSCSLLVSTSPSMEVGLQLQA